MNTFIHQRSSELAKLYGTSFVVKGAFMLNPHLIQSNNFLYSSHPSITVSRARHDESTSNLKHHVDQCAPPASGESRAITAYAHGSAYNTATHRMKLALWVARRHRPFAIVEDPELLDIFHDLNDKCATPSASTVSRDVKEIFQVTRLKVAQLLQAGLLRRLE